MGDHIDNLIIKPINRLCYCRWENLATHAQCGASFLEMRVTNSEAPIAMTDPMCDSCIHIFAIAMIDHSYV